MDKDNSDVNIGSSFVNWVSDQTDIRDVQAAVGGDAIAYLGWYAVNGSPFFGGNHLARRGPTGWSDENLTPRQSTQAFTECFAEYLFSTPDLSDGILDDGLLQAAGCPADDPVLVSGEPQGVQNLFVRDNTTPPSFQLVDPNPVMGGPGDAKYQGASADLSHVVFDESAQLTPDAPSGDDLYDWDGGAVGLVSEVPSPPQTSCSGGACTPETGAVLGDGQGHALNAVSTDGSRIFFTVGSDLYVRDGGTTTAQVDAPAPGASGPGGGGDFMTASADGSAVFFTDDASAGLTTDTIPGSGTNLYRYDVASGTLTDLTPTADAQVQGTSGVSDDGSYLYFVANGVLTTTPNSQGATASAGQPNLYLRHGASTTFIATLGSNDFCDWTDVGAPACPTVRVTPDGTHLVFDSTASLTGYDNTPAAPQDCVDGAANSTPCTEIFLYDAAQDQLVCASCNPSGARPVGNSWLDGEQYITPFLVGKNSYQPHNLSSDGTRLLFTSGDALVPADGNGKWDVYEYEADGSGSCQSTAQNGGCVYLLSSGTSDVDSRFLDASASGNDVFFGTYQQLLPQDQDGAADLYDARVDGGFPEPTPSTPCTGDACKGPVSAAPPPPTAGSVNFSGPGNSAGASPRAKARVMTRAVRGATFLLKVKVPARGRVTITGARVRTVRKSLSHAGTYRLRISLTAGARRLLAHSGRLRLTLRVSYAQRGTGAAVALVRLTVRRSPGERAADIKPADGNHGGAR